MIIDAAVLSPFMCWAAGLFIFPLMLLYTATSVAVLSGRVTGAQATRICQRRS